MYKFFIRNSIIGIVFIGVYGFLRLVLSCPEEISFIIVILLLLGLYSKLTSLVESFSDYLIPDKNKVITKTLDHFNNRLNDISHYHELLSEFYHLFNNILPQKSWLFYVFEGSSFRMVKYDSSKEGDTFPQEIKFTIDINKGMVQNIRDLRTDTSVKPNLTVELFINNKMESVIPIAGKSQIVALLISEELNLEMLKNTQIAKRVEKSLYRAGQILENTALYLDVIQRNLEIKKIYEVSQKLLTSIRTEEILEFLLDALSEVIPVDAGVIFLFDPQTKKLFKKVSQGYEEGIDLTLKIGQGACGWVAETRRISLIKNVEYADHYYPIRHQTRSQISIPLEIQNKLMGVLSLESNEVGYFTFRSIELLNLFANQAVIALYNAKQYEISLAKKHLEHELLNAAKVQRCCYLSEHRFTKTYKFLFPIYPANW